MAHPENRSGWTDQKVEEIMGNLLRIGVSLAALIVLAGGAFYLLRHGDQRPDYSHFAPAVHPGLAYRSVSGIFNLARAEQIGQGRALIMIGLVLLILTPIARVVFSIYAFIRERDWLYVVVTLIVLCVLLFSLLGEH